MQLARNALKKLRTIRHPDVYVLFVHSEKHVVKKMSTDEEADEDEVTLASERRKRGMLEGQRGYIKELMDLRIKYIDSVETDTHVYIATERVRPLNAVLRDWETGGSLGGSKGKGRENWVGWGVRSIAVSECPLSVLD